MPRKPGKRLTDKQRRFVKEYLIDCNATRSAKAAGYSEASADQLGWQLLENPLVSAEIERGRKRLFDKLDLSAERILQELAVIGFSKLTDVASWEHGGRPELIDSDDMTDEARRALKSISFSESESSGETNSSSRSISFSMHDKVKALELLGKWRKLFTDKLEHTGKDGEPLSFVALVEQFSGSHDPGKKS